MARHAFGPEGHDGVRPYRVDDLTYQQRTQPERDTVAATVAEAQPVMLVHADGGQLPPAQGGYARRGAGTMFGFAVLAIGGSRLSAPGLSEDPASSHTTYASGT